MAKQISHTYIYVSYKKVVVCCSYFPFLQKPSVRYTHYMLTLYTALILGNIFIRLSQLNIKSLKKYDNIECVYYLQIVLMINK